ncbi:MAG: fibrobacter succinogenes major paralogous domain-containing protein [Bacteroidetes bacterium]|nr:fibrobacter succinogenes major paralogous domain-containing protein [Bacteroidota bacterium]
MNSNPTISNTTSLPTTCIAAGLRWSAFNLNTDHFRNGDIIPVAESAEDWEAIGQMGEPACCWYRNDRQIGAAYGRLYNWFALNDSRGLAPEGWRIPMLSDWERLALELGGFPLAGRRLKSKSGWNMMGNGNNQSGFSAMPGGGRGVFGSFLDLGDYGNWWAANEASPNDACFVYLTFIDSSMIIRKDGFKSSGFSVRCVQPV